MTIGKVICSYTIEPLFDPVPAVPGTRTIEPVIPAQRPSVPALNARVVSGDGLAVLAWQREG